MVSDEVPRGHVYRSVRAYRGTEIKIHAFDLSGCSTVRFTLFTLKERSARTEMIGSVHRAASLDCERRRSPLSYRH